MGPKPASVLLGKWDQVVQASVRRGNRLRRGPIRKEPLILRLLGPVSWNGGHLLEYRASVHRGDDRVANHVSVVGKEVQCDHVARYGAVHRT